MTIIAMRPAVENIQVLLIDDNEADLVIISRMLEEIQGKAFTIFSHRKIDEAVHYLQGKNQMPDICLVDYNLNADTALDFIAALNEVKIPRPPIVVMTGQTEETIAKHLASVGVYDYFDKNNLEPEGLCQLIDAALQRHS